jgi:hypothetical protein
LDFYDKGVAPRKNIDVMKAAIEITENKGVNLSENDAIFFLYIYIYIPSKYLVFCWKCFHSIFSCIVEHDLMNNLCVFLAVSFTCHIHFMIVL